MTAFLKGMNVWTLPTNFSIEEQFSITKDAGFDTIELNLSEVSKAKNFVNGTLGLSDKLDLTLNTSMEELRKMKQLSEQYQLPISSISTSLLWQYPLSSNDKKIVEKATLIVKKMIDFCKFFGGDTVLVVPGIVTENQSYDVVYKNSKENIGKLIDYAQKNEITIGIENVWNKFLLSPIEYCAFIDSFESDWIKAYFDVGNVLQYGFPEQWIQILGSRICKIHVKDFKQAVGTSYGFCNLLNGDVNWLSVMKALKSIDYKGSITCELTPYALNGEQIAIDTSQAMDILFSI